MIEIGLVGITGGVAAAAAIIATRFASDPGDVLGFFGSALGSGFAVIGALWLSQRDSHTKRIQDHQLMYDALSMIWQYSDANTDFDNKKAKIRILGVLQSISGYESIRAIIQIDDAIRLSAFNALNYWFPLRKVELENLLKSIDDEALDEHEAMKRASGIIEPMCKSVKAIMDMDGYWLARKGR